MVLVTIAIRAVLADPLQVIWIKFNLLLLSDWRHLLVNWRGIRRTQFAKEKIVNLNVIFKSGCCAFNLFLDVSFLKLPIIWIQLRNEL